MTMRRWTMLLATCAVLFGGACSRHRTRHGDDQGSNPQLDQVRQDLAASQERMRAAEARMQAMSQQQAMQSAENQGLRQQLQAMGTKMQQAEGRMNAMQHQARIARREMEGMSQNASAMSEETPDPRRYPAFSGPLGNLRNDMDGIARGMAQSAVAHPGAFSE